MQPVLTAKPYSFNKSLLEAYEYIFSLVDNEDWVCLMDGDACFVEMSNYGHILNHYITRYPNTGLFTCMATQCSYEFQTAKVEGYDSRDWARVCKEYFDRYHNTPEETEIFERRFAGHLVLMKKSTWNMILPRLRQRIKDKGKKILGFDTQLSHTMTDLKLEKRLIKGIVLDHNFRLLTGVNDKIV